MAVLEQFLGTAASVAEAVLVVNEEWSQALRYDMLINASQHLSCHPCSSGMYNVGMRAKIASRK